MYDNHIENGEYRNLKNKIADILNGDDTETDIMELEERVYELYDEGELSSSQYDDLMSYIYEVK